MKYLKSFRNSLNEIQWQVAKDKIRDKDKIEDIISWWKRRKRDVMSVQAKMFRKSTYPDRSRIHIDYLTGKIDTFVLPEDILIFCKNNQIEITNHQEKLGMTEDVKEEILAKAETIQHEKGRERLIQRVSQGVKLENIIEKMASVNFRETGYEKITEVFDELRAATGPKNANDRAIMISRDPFDIAVMSTNQMWESCRTLNVPKINLKDKTINFHDIESADNYNYEIRNRENNIRAQSGDVVRLVGGCFSDKLEHDIKEGSMIAYSLKREDAHSAMIPVSRVLIFPYRTNSGAFFYFPGPIYGVKDITFRNTVISWLGEFYKGNEMDVEQEDFFKLNDNIYDDGQLEVKMAKLRNGSFVNLNFARTEELVQYAKIDMGDEKALTSYKLFKEIIEDMKEFGYNYVENLGLDLAKSIPNVINRRKNVYQKIRMSEILNKLIEREYKYLARYHSDEEMREIEYMPRREMLKVIADRDNFKEEIEPAYISSVVKKMTEEINSFLLKKDLKEGYMDNLIGQKYGDTYMNHRYDKELKSDINANGVLYTMLKKYEEDFVEIDGSDFQVIKEDANEEQMRIIEEAKDTAVYMIKDKFIEELKSEDFKIYKAIKLIPEDMIIKFKTDEVFMYELNEFLRNTIDGLDKSFVGNKSYLVDLLHGFFSSLAYLEKSGLIKNINKIVRKLDTGIQKILGIVLNERAYDFSNSFIEYSKKHPLSNDKTSSVIEELIREYTEGRLADVIYEKTKTELNEYIQLQENSKFFKEMSKHWGLNSYGKYISLLESLENEEGRYKEIKTLFIEVLRDVIKKSKSGKLDEFTTLYRIRRDLDLMAGTILTPEEESELEAMLEINKIK